MIHTLTLNPSLDYLLSLDEFVPGGLNRAREAQLFEGGKGINVALMLARLGQPVRALGFRAGATGRLLRELLAAEGLEEALLPLPEGFTRINLKLEAAAEETELNGPGPAPGPAALAALERQLAAIPPEDTLVAAGSLPPGLPADSYDRLLTPCAARGVRCVLDTGGEALRAGLAARPWLIKPNLAELAGLLGLSAEEQAALAPKPGEAPGPALLEAMCTAQSLGARNVLVSLGGQGAALLAERGELRYQPAPAGRPVNTAGAGDSLLAGFLAELGRSASPTEALRLGVAAGSATAFSPALASAEAVRRLAEAGRW